MPQKHHKNKIRILKNIKKLLFPHFLNPKQKNLGTLPREV
jgi:hypothetical protein